MARPSFSLRRMTLLSRVLKAMQSPLGCTSNARHSELTKKALCEGRQDRCGWSMFVMIVFKSVGSMVKRDPDDIISAISKNLKAEKAPVMRITFKRGGLWKPEFAKAHSRIAKRAISTLIKAACTSEEDKQWPLLVRFHENDSEATKRLNCQLKIGRSGQFIESMLSVLRNKMDQLPEKNTATKPNPESKTSIRKKNKTLKNKDRSAKRKSIHRQIKKQRLIHKQK